MKPLISVPVNHNHEQIFYCLKTPKFDKFCFGEKETSYYYYYYYYYYYCNNPLETTIFPFVSLKKKNWRIWFVWWTFLTFY